MDVCWQTLPSHGPAAAKVLSPERDYVSESADNGTLEILSDDRS